MSLLSIVASSSAFLRPASPPPKGSSIDSDWSTKNKKQPGFLRLISASYAMVSLHDRRINSAANSEGHAGARNPYRSHVNFAPPAHPSAGAIGASLVVNCRAINSRRPALETFQRIDLIDLWMSRAHTDLARAAVGTALRARSSRHRVEYQPTYRTKCSNRSGIWWQSNSSHCAPGINWKLRFRPLCM